MKRKIRVNSCVSWAKLFFRGAFSQELCYVEVYKIGVMKNNRFNRALDLVTLVAVRGDHVKDFAGNTMLVSQGHAAKRVTHLLPKFPLDHIARCVLIILKRLAHIGQERTGNE